MEDKAQSIVIDLLILIIVFSIFFLFLMKQTKINNNEYISIRTKSQINDELLLSILNSKFEDDSTVLEGIYLMNCGENLEKDLNKTIVKIVSNYSKDLNFILISNKTKCFTNYESCCIKTEEINVAKEEFQTPCGRIEVEFGMWDKSMEVENC